MSSLKSVCSSLVSSQLLLLILTIRTASIAVGYENPRLLALAKTDEFATAAMARPALGSYPSTEWAEIIETGLLKVAPGGATQLTTMQDGSSANEGAMKAAFLAYQARRRGDAEFSPEEESSVMNNAAPGSPALSVLSFSSAFHGRTFGALSTTRSKAIHKVRFSFLPSFFLLRLPSSLFLPRSPSLFPRQRLT
jgi:4-aminobutyrate aminotransferase/(S)-3-amino-2-methylpropionate transaminase